MFYDQSDFDVRCEWGLSGVHLVGSAAEIVIIVDVLSFSTCVDVAVSRDVEVLPYRWRDERAREFAIEHGAELAGRRGEAGRFSLSPASLMNVTPGTCIVLPSPNGSELTTEAASLGRIVITGCFRNFLAVAAYAKSQGKSIAVIAAGERWPDETLRPAVEDLAAAGAIIAELSRSLSPEARIAVAAWNSIRDDLPAFLMECSSGRELTERGFMRDVEIASQANASMTVPILHEGAYRRADSFPL